MSSPGIVISIDNAPDKDVIVRISNSAGATEGLVIEPTELVFTRDVNELEFKIKIGDTWALGLTPLNI
jgi:hypothetical protein